MFQKRRKQHDFIGHEQKKYIISVIIATNGREVGVGSRTSIVCNVTLIDHPVTVVWKREGRTLGEADEIEATAGTFGDNYQIHTLDILSAIADSTYTCQVTTEKYPKEAEKEKSISVSVFSKKKTLG